MLRDRIVINNNDTRERLLREKHLDLDKAINICRTIEMAVKQLHSMDTTDTVHYTRSKFGRPQSKSKQNAQVTNCKYSGDNNLAGNCKAYGKTCSKCHKRNNLVKVCMSKPQENWRNPSGRKPGKDKQDVHHLGGNSCSSENPESLSREERLYTIDSRHKKRKYFAGVLVGQDAKASTPIKFQLDIGAT